MGLSADQRKQTLRLIKSENEKAIREREHQALKAQIAAQDEKIQAQAEQLESLKLHFKMQFLGPYLCGFDVCIGCHGGIKFYDAGFHFHDLGTCDFGCGFW